MGAPKGNKYAVGNSGKPKKYKPEELYQKALDYINWCDTHPIRVPKISKGGVIDVMMPRPYIIEGFCNHADLSVPQFYEYEKDTKNGEYPKIIARIRALFIEQKKSGAMVGLFESNIVARELSMPDHVNRTEKTEIKLSKESLKEWVNDL